MGRGIRHKKKGQNGNGGRDDRGQRGYKDIVRENEWLENFYRSQSNLCPTEEFDEMIRVLKSDLPASFRITGYRSQAKVLRDVIKGQYLEKLSKLADCQQTEISNKLNGTDVIDPPKIIRPSCLTWYPDQLAWQLNLTRKDIRREEAYFKLHNFLISETESGNISRQETVSMIPPIVLDVKPHHKVLDMCAAPGSKTGQLIEAMHAIEDVVPEGLVVANDSDNSRCYMLVHQAKRLQSPSVIITNHDACIMPNLQMTSEDGSTKNMKFDRILCDVPCSGDGTLRKNADAWPKWSPATSVNLHGIQFRIAKRGLEMLEVGGRMVYSTCSLNPIEDEAVLYRLLQETGDAVEILDASQLVPGLKYSSGINKWKMAGKEKNVIYNEFSEVPEKYHNFIRPHMFSPQEGVDAKFHLDRCMRVLPHQQDTGGFFVAVLSKKSLCPWESKREQDGSNPQAENNHRNSNNRNGNGPPNKKPRYQGFREDPFIYFEEDDSSFEEVKKYFQLSDELEAKMFLSRHATKRNNLYFTSKLVRNLMQSNADRVKIINAGVKSFAKCENKGATCNFRLAQEGALMTIPFLGKRMIYPTKKDLQTLLLSSDIDHPPLLTEMEPDTIRQLEALETGSVAFIYEEPKEKQESHLKLEIVGWKGKASVRAYVPKNDRIHYLRLLGGDTSKYEFNKFEAKREEIITEKETNDTIINDDCTKS